MAAPNHFEIPHDMRAFAEKSVEQAKQAFDGFISATHQAVSAFEGQAETARQGAERNVASSFEFAQKLVRAKDIQELMRLQTDFIRNQMQILTEQARELGESAAAAAKEATTPKR